MKQYPRQTALRRWYSFCYNMASFPAFTEEQRAHYAKERDQITFQARRQQRIARIMRDPFYLQAERQKNYAQYS